MRVALATGLLVPSRVVARSVGQGAQNGGRWPKVFDRWPKMASGAKFSKRHAEVVRNVRQVVKSASASASESTGVTFWSVWSSWPKTTPRGLQNVAFPKVFWPPPAGAAHPTIFYSGQWRDARRTRAHPVWPTPRAHVRTGRTYAVRERAFAPPHSNYWARSEII